MTQPLNGRRFTLIATGEILAIVDQCRSYTIYGFISLAADGSVCLSGARTFFPDEVEEL